MTADYWPALLIGNLVFAGAGAVLSLLVCRVLGRVQPRLSRRAVMAAVVASVPVLIILVIGLARFAVEGFFSLSFILTMKSEGWIFLLTGTVAGLLLARRLAPAPTKVDPSVFE
jgi:hypothetical protein